MKVFMTSKIHPQGMELFSQAAIEVEAWDREKNGPITREMMIEKTKKVDGLVTLLADQIDAAFLTECKHLKIISNYAVGYNNIDCVKAKELGIIVTNTPDVLTEATAEETVARILATIRNFRAAQHLIDQGKWKRCESMLLLGTELKGKNLGMVGLGRIGARVAEICELGFGMKVIYQNRAGKSPYARPSFTPMPFEQLVKEADIISVLCPLNNESRNLFNEKTFKMMKKSAYFVNSARGEIHNEKDLFEALRDGTIAGAGLDVYNPEPIQMDSPLFTLPNIYLTPHIGSATHEARSAMTRMVAENIVRVFNNQEAITKVN